MHRKYALGLLAALILTLNACGKKEQPPQPASTPAPTSAPAPVPAGVTVTGVTLGKAVGADKKVAQPADSFAPKDTIYVSIDTAGAGNATLRARWTYRKNGQEALVKEDTQTISATGPASSEFHVSKPDGWPAGEYQVAVFVNDQPASTKTFSVK